MIERREEGKEKRKREYPRSNKNLTPTWII